MNVPLQRSLTYTTYKFSANIMAKCPVPLFKCFFKNIKFRNQARLCLAIYFQCGKFNSNVAAKGESLLGDFC